MVDSGSVTIEDLDSRNGTFVGERRISAPTRLVDGDELRLGTVRLTLRSAGEGSTATLGSKAGR